MKILLISVGTRGDIEPFLAVGQQLMQVHHEVYCAFPEQFRQDAEAIGAHFIGIPIDLVTLSKSDESRLIISGSGTIFQRINAYRSLYKSLKALEKPLWTSEEQIIRQCNPDKVIFHVLCHYSMLWSYLNPSKSMVMVIYPYALHAVDNHISMSPKGAPDLGLYLNRLSFYVANTIKAHQINSALKRFSARKTIPKISKAGLYRHFLYNLPARYAVSPSLFTKPKEWGNHIQIMGYPERKINAVPHVQDALNQFLLRHEKIVVISFGSMVNDRPEQLTQMFILVLKAQNQPALLLTGVGGLQKIDPQDDKILILDYIPFQLVLPKVYLFVHHGGSGATHSSVKYGCVSLVVPHMLDQYCWGEIIFEKKLGPKPIPIAKLTRSLFESTLQDALNNPTYKTNAERMSEQMKTENEPDKILNYIV